MAEDNVANNSRKDGNNCFNGDKSNDLHDNGAKVDSYTSESDLIDGKEEEIKIQFSTGKSSVIYKLKTIREILESVPEGRAIIDYFKKVGTLDNHHRNMVASIVVDYLYKWKKE